MTRTCAALANGLGALGLTSLLAQSPLPYTVVGTGQTETYDNQRAIPAPAAGQAFYGQDAQTRTPGPGP